jgi:hypothetical protein
MLHMQKYPVKARLHPNMRQCNMLVNDVQSSVLAHRRRSLSLEKLTPGIEKLSGSSENDKPDDQDGEGGLE